MTLQEILTKQGLTEDQVKAVTDAMKEAGIYTASEENLDTRYTKLKGDHDTLTSQYEEAQKLIGTLKSGTKDNDTLQQKVSEYETEVSRLTAENLKLKTENALKFALVNAGAEDVDYLMFKATSAKGELKLDTDGNIKGVQDLITDLKTQHPTMFKGSDGGSGGNGRRVFENNLPGGNHNEQTVTKEQYAAMGYNERLALKKTNPERFAQLQQQ